MRTNTKTKNKFILPSFFFGRVFIWGALVLFAISTVYLGIQVATSGTTLSKLEEEQASLIRENQILTSILVEKTSLSNNEGEVERLGFKVPERILYLSPNNNVAALSQ